MRNFACLSKRVSVLRHVRQDNKNMLLELVRIIFRGGESQAGRDDALDSRIVSQIQEQRHSIQRAVFLEVLFEKSGGLHVDTHGRKIHWEVVLVAVVYILRWALDKTSLPHNLRRNLQHAVSH